MNKEMNIKITKDVINHLNNSGELKFSSDPIVALRNCSINSGTKGYILSNMKSKKITTVSYERIDDNKYIASYLVRGLFFIGSQFVVDVLQDSKKKLSISKLRKLVYSTRTNGATSSIFTYFASDNIITLVCYDTDTKVLLYKTDYTFDYNVKEYI